MAGATASLVKWFGLFWCVILCAGPAQAAIPAAGFQIDAVANATYFHTGLGTQESITSNTVTTIVNTVTDFTVTEDQEIIRSPGENALFSFVVTNVGNAPLTIETSFGDLGGDFRIENIVIAIDANANGIIEAAELIADPALTIDLPIGAQVRVLVESLVPNTAGNGQRASGVLSGRDAASGTVRSATGTVLIGAQSVDVRKTASVSRAQEGGEIVYTLRLRNNSLSSIEPVSIFGNERVLIDGVETAVILLRDDIPLHTTFSRIVNPVNFTAVYHLVGEPEFTFTATPPSDPARIDAVAFVSEDPFPSSSSRDFQFAVRVNPNTDGLFVNNQAEFLLPQPDGTVTETDSNIVTTPIEGTPGVLEFFETDAFENLINAADYGETVFLELRSGQCNLSQDVEEISINILTTPNGDRETVTARETGPNTGIFRTGPIPVTDELPPVPENGALSGDFRETATATATCDPSVEDAITIQPAAFVFMSTNNEPVPNAMVELVDESGVVVDSMMTDETGVFRLESVEPVMHTLVVTPPAGFLTPSTRTEFPDFNRNVDPEASYEIPFMPDDTGRIPYDVPVDPDLTNALQLSKTADRNEVQTGRFVRYELEFRNRAALGIEQARLIDDLPPGFLYVDGSARLDGESLPDPDGTPGARLTFDVGLIRPSAVHTLSYLVRVGPTVGQGDKINTAIVEGTMAGLGQMLQSNVARATVRVDDRGGVFSREGVILGKVYLDCNADGQQNGPAELGVPGVQIHTQEGISVVTDTYGRFTLPGLRAVTHVLDVDEGSLPSGTEVNATRVFDAMNGGSRFVDLKAGEIRSEDFALTACSPDVNAAVQDRIERFKARAQGESAEVTDLAFEATTLAFSDDYEKVAETATLTKGAVPPRAEGGNAQEDQAKTPDVATADDLTATRDLEEAVLTATPALGFLDLRDGMMVVQQQISIRVKGPAKGALSVSVNGNPIAADRIGQQRINPTSGVQVIEYVAIGLGQGENTIALTQTDPFGNVRGEQTITVIAPGEPARLEIIAPPEALADPAAAFPVIIRVVDAAGHPTLAPVEVTLSATEGEWDVRDIRDTEIGLQTFIDNGEAVFDFTPPTLVGTYTLRATSTFGEAETQVKFSPNLDQRLFVGYIEGALKFGEGGETLEGLMSKDDLSGFEETEEGVNGAVYLKGKILGSTLMTLRYDSDKDTEERLFRDVDPDRFYPVYGDTSERGYDARSKGKLFVKVEKGQSYVLYGDVTYAPEAEAFELGGFQRSLEGSKVHVEAGPVSLDFFAAYTDNQQVVEEIAARGISGPYDLDFNDVVENSETVEILTRDRDQPSVILNTERLTRFVDYTLDYFNRTLIFNRPIPARDENFNPISIRVTFETSEGGGEKYWVYGGEARVDITDGVAAGYREMRSDAPREEESRRMVRAAYVEAELDGYGKLEVEVAQTRNNEGDKGDAARLSYEYQDEKTMIRARAAKTGADFDAPGSSISAGREEVRVETSRRIGASTVVKTEGLYTADTEEADRRYGVVSRIETRLSREVQGRIGARYVSDRNSDRVSQDFVSAIIGVSWSPSSLPGATADLEYEQDVTDFSHYRVSLGSDYNITPDIRVYLDSEYSTTDGGLFGLQGSEKGGVNIRGGVEYKWNKNINVFTEYRADEGFYDSGIASGLSGNWALSPALDARLRVEHVQPVSDDFRKNTSVSVGGTWSPENQRWLLDTDLEFALDDEDRRTWYTSTAVGYRWKSYTFLARNRFALTEEAGGNRLRDRLRVGAAYRPTDNDTLNLLAWYEYQVEDDADLDEESHIWSLGGEYKTSARMRLRGRYAGQVYRAEIEGLKVNSFTHLIETGIDYDVFDRLNVGVNAALMSDGDFNTFRWGAGAEISYAVAPNALVSVGYNYAKIKEKQIRDIYYTGFFVRLRVKFDQDVWNIFGDWG